MKFNNFENGVTNFGRALLLFVVLWTSASAAHMGFYSKWQLGDFSNRFNVEAMIDGSAHKPFVFRQLAPAISRFLDGVTPEPIKNALENAVWEKHDFRYLVVYYLHFIFVFLSIIALRMIMFSEGVSYIVATLSPCIFLLFTPFLQTVGGFYYDNIELFFLASSILMAKNHRILGLAVLTVFATYNKESFLLFIPCLYPFLKGSTNMKQRLVILAGLMLIALVINLHLKTAFSENEGGNVEFWFFKNAQEYFSLRTYFKFEETYGLPSPKGMNILTLLAIFSISYLGWKGLSRSFREHTYIGIFVSLPLFILFCFTGELRNLSFLYVSFSLMLAWAIEGLGGAQKASKWS